MKRTAFIILSLLAACAPPAPIAHHPRHPPGTVQCALVGNHCVFDALGKQTVHEPFATDQVFVTPNTGEVEVLDRSYLFDIIQDGKNGSALRLTYFLFPDRGEFRLDSAGNAVLWMGETLPDDSNSEFTITGTCTLIN